MKANVQGAMRSSACGQMLKSTPRHALGLLADVVLLLPSYTQALAQDQQAPAQDRARGAERHNTWREAPTVPGFTYLAGPRSVVALQVEVSE